MRERVGSEEEGEKRMEGPRAFQKEELDVVNALIPGCLRVMELI